MRISVIVPAHNEEKALPATLGALLSQTARPHEIIVVCNGCADRTADMARLPGITRIVTERKGVSLARNLGARKATGDVLFFMDADVVLSRDFLEKLGKALNGKKRFVGSARATPDMARYRPFFALLNAVTRLFRTTSNGMMFLPKALYGKSGGFPEDLSINEDHLFMRAVERLPDVSYFFFTGAEAVASTRRLRKKGVLGQSLFWIRAFLTRDKRHLTYPTVR